MNFMHIFGGVCCLIFMSFIFKEKKKQPPCDIQVLLSLVPYLCAAAAASGRSYKCYIIRSGAKRFPLITGVRSHLMWLLHSVSFLPYLLFHRLLKSPHSRRLTHTNTTWVCVPSQQAQNTLAKPGVNHCTKSSLQSPVSSQRAVGTGSGGVDLDDLIDWRRGKKNFSFGPKTREENWGQAERSLLGRVRAAKEKKRSWKMEGKKRGKWFHQVIQVAVAMSWKLSNVSRP